MNLAKLFEMQKVLRDRIGYNQPDRFNKLVLALLVEVGECANEWRGFKYWSVNQIPHISAVRTPCMMEEDKVYYNPMLEEFVDGLHFVLEIGLELGFQPIYAQPYKYKNVTNQFKELYWEISCLDKSSHKENFLFMFSKFVGLGEMLGFTWDQIEQAYYVKHEINMKRQESGY